MGSHCLECVGVAQPSTRERVRVNLALGTPYVTYTLVAINILMYVVASPGSGTWFDMGISGIGIDVFGERYRIVTGAFVHGSVMHTGFNMLLLYQLGTALERLLGIGRFVGVFAVSLLGGSFGVLLLSSGNTFTVGASGAVFGLMASFASILRTRGGDIWNSGIGGLIVINLLITFIIPNISIGGHLGGLVAGAAAGWRLDVGDRRRPARLSNALAAVFVLGVSAALFVGSTIAAGIAVDRLQ